MGRGRRWAWPALGVAALVGAVVVLRTSSGVADRPNPNAPLEFFAADGVTGPPTPDPPQAPQDLHATPGAGHVVLDWRPGAGVAAGYEVRVGPVGQPSRSRLVAGTSVDLNNLDDGDSYRAEIRAVDSVGRRSPPAELEIRTDPQADAALREKLTGFYDNFDDIETLFRTQWRIPVHGTADTCLRRGSGIEEGYLLVLPNCPQGTQRTALPFILGPPDAAGVRGRVVISLDGPAAPPPGTPAATVTLALVPAAVSDLPPGPELAVPPGTAALDPRLPPGSLLLRWATDGPSLIVGPGGAGAPAAEQLAPLPAATPGTPHHWELTIGTRDVTVSRDGVAVLRAPVAVAWPQATVLLTSSADGRVGRLRFDMLGFSGPTSSPTLVRVLDAVGGTAVSTEMLAGADGLRFLGYLPPALPGPPAPAPRIRLGGAQAELRSALPGGAQPPADFPRPVIADLPVAALGDPAAAGTLIVDGGTVQQGQLEVSVGPRLAALPLATRLPRQPPEALPVPQPAVVGFTAESSRRLDPAAGPLPHERVMVRVSLDGAVAQADAGEVGGLAGLAVELDGAPLLTLPTATDGPGVGGVYEFGLDVSRFPPGQHRLSVRAVAARGGADTTVSTMVGFS